MTKTPTAKSSTRPNTLKIERVFDATPETLWSYWTDPRKFAKWFNPAPAIDLVIHEYDVRPGGRVRFDMPQPDGNRNPQEGVFLALDPYREIVTGSPNKSFVVRVIFKAVGKKARMTVTVTSIRPEHHEGATKGWNAGFDKLALLLGGPAKPRKPRSFTIERTFRASIEKVWAMWTTKDGLESWWGPEGFTTTVRRLDLRPGGGFEYAMTATGRAQVKTMKAAGLPLTSVARGTYTEVAPPRRLGYKTLADFIPGVAPYEVGAVIEFHAVGKSVKVVVTEGTMHDEQWTEMSVMGLTSSLDKLARALEG